MAACTLEKEFDNLGLNDKSPGYYFHGDWVDVSGLTLEICNSVIRSIKTDYQEAVEDEDEMLLTIYYHGMEYLSDVCTSAFLQKVSGKQKQAVADLKAVEMLVEKARSNSIIESAYLDGINFVVGVLRKYIHGQRDREEDESAYNKLRTKSEAAVLAAKDYFFERLPGLFWKYRNNEPKQMITLDQDNPEWYLRVYKEAWHKYRGAGKDRLDKKRLLDQMKEAVESAMLIDGDNPRVLMHNIECLRELSKGAYRRGEWRVECAGEIFSSLDELKQAILNKTNKILVANSSVRVMLRIVMSVCIRSNSGFNMTARPDETKLAKRLLDEAYEKCPKSGQVLHKLGLYTLIIDGDTDKAADYFRNSLREWPDFYSALVDLIMTLMSHPEENQKEILSLIDTNLEGNQCSEEQRMQLIEHKGTTLFMLGQYTDGIKLWLESGYWSIGSVLFRCNRYKWPRDKLSFDLIHAEMAAMAALERNDSNTELQEALEEAQYYSSPMYHVPPPFLGARGLGGPNSVPRGSYGYSNYSRAGGSQADQDDNWRN